MNLCEDWADIAFRVGQRGIRIDRYEVVLEGGAKRILDAVQSLGAHLSGADAFLMNGFPRLPLQLQVLLIFGRVGLNEVDDVDRRPLRLLGLGGCGGRQGACQECSNGSGCKKWDPDAH